MTSQTCQNCKNSFEITKEDLELLAKLEVPSPTFCPDCRAQRRWSFRNERTFYSRTCDLCKKTMIAMYDQEAPFPVYCQECWWSDKWDPMQYGRDYDFNKTFFEQNQELRRKVPRVAIINRNSVNCEFTNISANNKDCYLLIESSNNENCYYGYWLEEHCKDIFDSAFLTSVEGAYQSLFCWSSSNIFFCQDSRDCIDSWFLLDCVNCQNCFGCVNLRNANYQIFNKQYTKEEYEKKLQEMNLGTFSGLQKVKKEFEDFSKIFPRRFAYTRNIENSSGDYLVNSRNLFKTFYAEKAENLRYAVHAFGDVKDNMDIDTVGLGGELVYESINTALKVYNMKFCMRCWTGRDSMYCDNCDNIDSCFGCISLHGKSFCILNKQYTEGEYEELKKKIIAQMNEKPYRDNKNREYKFGEFFPSELSPFAYNETIAQEYFRLNELSAKETGFAWKPQAAKNYKVSLKAENLPDNIQEAQEDIVKEIIGCAHEGKCDHQCSTAFKMLPQEVSFYKKSGLPLPRLCPNCRHYERIENKRPLKLWSRDCSCEGTQTGSYKNTGEHFHGTSKCPNTLETSYSTHRKETVYCDQCYTSEVA